MIDRPESLHGVTFKLKFDHIPDAIYITLNFLEGKPIELFINSKDPEVLKWSNLFTRLASGAFREGNSSWVFKELRGIFDAESFWYKGRQYNSVAQAIGETLEEYISNTQN